MSPDAADLSESLPVHPGPCDAAGGRSAADLGDARHFRAVGFKVGGNVSLVLSSALAVILLWLPALMLSPKIGLVGPFVPCHPQCPRNVLLVADWPALSWTLNTAFRVVGVLIMIATGALLFSRLRRATPLLRRAIAPVLLASIARTLAIAVFLVTDAIWLACALTFWAVPLAIALGLLRGRLYTARALQTTGHRPARASPTSMRCAMSWPARWAMTACRLPIGSRTARAGSMPTARKWHAPAPSTETGRAVTLLRDAEGRAGRRVDSRQRTAGRTHVARIGRQQHADGPGEPPAGGRDQGRGRPLGLCGRGRAPPHRARPARRRPAAADRPAHEAERDRATARPGSAPGARRWCRRWAPTSRRPWSSCGRWRTASRPPLLVERGLAVALTEAAQRTALPTRTRIDEIGRCDPAIESAVYFCCLEALQNAAKHAGPNASVQLSLDRDGDQLRFCIEDDGVTPAATQPATDGQGLANMRGRIEAVGGQTRSSGAGGPGVSRGWHCPARHKTPAH